MLDASQDMYVSISKLIHIQSLKIDASLLIVTSQRSEGKNKQGANKLFIRHWFSKPQITLGRATQDIE